MWKLFILWPAIYFMLPFAAVAGVLIAGLGVLASSEIALGASLLLLAGSAFYFANASGAMPKIKSALGGGWRALSSVLNALFAKHVYDTYDNEGAGRAGEELAWGVVPGAVAGKALKTGRLSKFIDDLAKARFNQIARFFGGDARLAGKYLDGVAADVKLNQGRVLSREEALAEAASRISKSKWFLEKDGKLFVMEQGVYVNGKGMGWKKIWERREAQFASMGLNTEEEAQQFLYQKFKGSKLYMHTDGETSLLKDGKKTAYYYAEINPPINKYKYTIFVTNPDTGQFITSFSANNLNDIVNQRW